jgi:hypothetical protein
MEKVEVTVLKPFVCPFMYEVKAGDVSTCPKLAAEFYVTEGKVKINSDKKPAKFKAEEVE